jgi:hypothetical protein
MIPLDKFKMGYFILYKNDGSFFGKTIVKRQLLAGFTPNDAQIIHVEVSGGEIHSINISPPLSKLVDITQAHKNRYAYLVKYKGYNDDGKRYKVAYFSAALCANKFYDITGVFAFLSFLSKWIKQNNRLYFCSEGCAMALQMVFPNVLGNLTPDKIMPAHFLDIDNFEIVWEGIIT